MPIYEYECQHCHHHCEKLQKISDPALIDCPQCGKPTLKRLISAAGFQLKGSGWYVTDFRDKKSGQTDASSAKSEAGEKKETASVSAAEKKPDTSETKKE